MDATNLTITLFILGCAVPFGLEAIKVTGRLRWTLGAIAVAFVLAAMLWLPIAHTFPRLAGFVGTLAEDPTAWFLLVFAALAIAREWWKKAPRLSAPPPDRTAPAPAPAPPAAPDPPAAPVPVPETASENPPSLFADEFGLALARVDKLEEQVRAVARLPALMHLAELFEINTKGMEASWQEYSAVAKAGPDPSPDSMSDRYYEARRAIGTPLGGFLENLVIEYLGIDSLKLADSWDSAPGDTNIHEPWRQDYRKIYHRFRASQHLAKRARAALQEDINRTRQTIEAASDITPGQF
jgi:hypothetical protein